MKTKSTLRCLVFAFCVNIYLPVHAQAVNKQDSLALVDLYNSTDGPNWYYNKNWLTNKPLSTWDLITVTGTRVTEIYTRGNNLTGAIPSSLGNLGNLQWLDLSLNYNLNGSIPSSLGNLVNLAHFDLSYNQLSGSIPSSIGNLKNLGSLRLQYNKLSGSIPSSLGNLVNLQELWLYHNKLSGIPSSLGNLANVYVYLDHNRFTFDAMEFIAKKIPWASYAPQSRIPLHQNGNTLSVSAGGTLSNNTYRWCKVTDKGLVHFKTIKGDSVFHPTESGDYVVAVTNKIATELTLYSKPITFAPSNNHIIASSENALQRLNKGNFFSVYPNPAKDILNIRANAKTLFTLSDQSGKILFTKTIEGNGVMNVTALPAGPYYLRNTATGEVKKVVIEK